MTKIYNRRILKTIRKDLRNNLTFPEQILWSVIKGKQLGVKFRRQQSIGNYVVDFYCPEKRLVIELDGDSHFEDKDSQIKDQRRDAELKDMGIQVLRFTNKDVHESLEGVVDQVETCIHKSSATPSISPLERGRNRSIPLLSNEGLEAVVGMLPKILAIVGPTASGKSSLAIELAKKFHGEILSVDSRQIYKGMDIGTAKEPGVWDSARGVWMVGEIPHWGINIVTPDTPYSVADFQVYARQIIEEILSRGHLPILVGGTGLWLRAVLEQYDLATSPPDQDFRLSLVGKTTEELYAEYQKQDPEGAQKIDRANPRRLIRALEVIRQTGRSFFSSQQKSEPMYHVLQIGLCPDRTILYERINARIDQMMTQGLVEEVRGFQTRYGSDIPSMSGIGYRQIDKFLKDETTLEQAKEEIKKDTRHYAKRQWTWFKRDQSIHWVKTFAEAEVLVLSFLS